jgi:nitroreductase
VTGLSLLEGLATTRAIRRFRPDPVSDEDLAAVFFGATRAPSGSNRQPFRFLVLRDGPRAREARALLGRAFREAWQVKAATDGYPEDDDGRRGRTARALRQFVERFEDVPVVVLACLVRYRAPHPTEGASVYPACQNLLLAARALGYGGVMSMWHGFVDAELREALGIPDDVVIAATITLGVPEGRHGPVRRLPLREVVYDDRWEGDAGWAADPPGTRFSRAGPEREANPA